MRISDWSSDVCSSDLPCGEDGEELHEPGAVERRPLESTQSVDEEPLHLVGGHVTEELLPQLVEQMFLQRVPNDVQPAGRQIDIERLGLQMEPFGRFEEAEMEPGLVDGGAAQKVKAKRGLAASRWPHGKRHRAKRKATSRQPVKIGAAAGDAF